MVFLYDDDAVLDDSKDYIQVIRYKQHNLLVKEKVSLKMALLRITLHKIFYYGYIIVLPVLFSGMPWYHIIFGFLLMHFIAGFFLSCIFQPAHIVESPELALPLPTEPTFLKALSDHLKMLKKLGRKEMHVAY